MTTALAATATELQDTLTRLTETQADVITQQFNASSTLSAEQVRDFYLYAYPDLVQEMGAVAELVTTEWYAGLNPDSYYQPVAAPVAPGWADALQRDVRWAAGLLFGVNDAAPNQFLTRLVGAGTRHLFTRSRDTVTFNTEREGVRWARHAHADACPFCRLSASRGPVYSSGKMAGGDPGHRYHNHCRCVAVPVRTSTPYTPPKYQLEWEADYNRIADELETTDRDQVVNHWRQLIASGDLT